MRISFGNLIVDKEAIAHAGEALRTNWISGGVKVKKLEDSWGDLFNYKHNVAMSSGTSADIAMCMALYDIKANGNKVSPGDEIIAPALAFAAVGNSIRAAGFKPVFVDIDKATLNINESLIEEKITPKTKAIMAVHTMGKPCKMKIINEIAKKYDLRVLEDCCESHGGKYNGEFVGSLGDMSAFSFYVAHIISCGDGGMLSTNSEEFKDVVDSIKTHGRKKGSLYFDHIRYGLNFRMNDLTASIGIPEVRKFWDIFNKRKDNFYYLKEKTSDLQDLVFFTEENSNEVVSPHAFSLTLKDPKLNYKNFYDFLEQNSIQCKRNFGSMPTQHKAFEYLGHKLGEFPEAEYVGENGLHFGIHQYLSKEDLDYASEIVHKYFKRG